MSAPRLLFARGADDPALYETAWPLIPDDDHGLEWTLRYGTPTRSDMLCAAEVIAAYRALTGDGTTVEQVRRLAALRRVRRRQVR